MGQQRIRLIDVAREAQVSKATASRVLNHTERNVAPDLVAKVRKAALTLGYKPNHSARALRTGLTGTIGLVVPSLSNPYFVAVANAFGVAAQESGSDILIADSRNDLDAEALHCERLSTGKVDAMAIIPIAYKASANAVSACASRIPTVQIDRRTDTNHVPSVVLDNRKGMQLLIDYLYELGLHRIVHIGAESDSSSGFERITAFRELVGDDADMIEVSTFTTDGGRIAASLLKKKLASTEAIICGADVLAVSVQSTLIRAGFQIPEDLAIVSFDNSELLEIVDPPITSLEQPLDEMARLAMSVLSSAERSSDPLFRLTPKLTVRDSTRTQAGLEHLS